MKRNIKRNVIFALIPLIFLLVVFLWPVKHELNVTMNNSEQGLSVHRYNMPPEQTMQFAKAILPRLGWTLESQDRNVLVAKTRRFCRVTITVQNTQMGEASLVEMRSESFWGISDLAVNKANLHALQRAMDEKLPRSAYSP
jgi:uncharacterized protein (DUF1499 family)